MKKIIFPYPFFAFFISCNNEKETPAVKSGMDTSTLKDTTVTTPAPTDTASVISEPPTLNKILQKATYVSATYYTGRGDFYFTDEKGKRIEVGIGN